MKKIFIALILLVTATTSLSAQGGFKRGVAWGADRDTLMFVIGSPFDNWYINVGGGLQTFIGNEIESSARCNKLNFNLALEIGKWLIPDVAVSLRLAYFNVDGQSRYPLQPFIDYTGAPTYINPEDGLQYYEYQPFSAHALTLMGFVNFDWTNFFKGYEVGRRTQLHWLTDIGLGISMLFGEQKNPTHNDEIEIGDFRRNFELAFSIRGGAEYEFNDNIAANAKIELFGSESTWDWSPYDNSHSIFDIIPSFNIGVKFNLLSRIKKFHPENNTTSLDTVYHYFRSFGSKKTVSTLQGRIEKLQSERDDILNRSLSQQNIDSLLIDSINRELGRLQEKLKQYTPDLSDKNIYGRGNKGGDENDMDKLINELLDIADLLDIPHTVVYFELDKHYLDYNARKNLQDFSKKVKSLDDTIEFYMIGAADSLTGSIPHNQRLSEKRCNAVHDMLTKNFNISANQFIRVFAGGINDYSPQEDNRMVLVIQRTPVTEEIVDRWNRMARERMEKYKSKGRR